MAAATENPKGTPSSEVILVEYRLFGTVVYRR